MLSLRYDATISIDFIDKWSSWNTVKQKSFLDRLKNWLPDFFFKWNQTFKEKKKEFRWILDQPPTFFRPFFHSVHVPRSRRRDFFKRVWVEKKSKKMRKDRRREESWDRGPIKRIFENLWKFSNGPFYTMLSLLNWIDLDMKRNLGDKSSVEFFSLQV